MSALMLSLFLALSPPQDRSILNRGVDPVWLFIGMAVGSIVSGFAITGIFLAIPPRSIGR